MGFGYEHLATTSPEWVFMFANGVEMKVNDGKLLVKRNDTDLELPDRISDELDGFLNSFHRRFDEHGGNGNG